MRHSPSKQSRADDKEGRGAVGERAGSSPSGSGSGNTGHSIATVRSINPGRTWHLVRMALPQGRLVLENERSMVVDLRAENGGRCRARQVVR
jgi:hypothetical protein